MTQLMLPICCFLKSTSKLDVMASCKAEEDRVEKYVPGFKAEGIHFT